MKLCGKLITSLLRPIFQSILDDGNFFRRLEKSNVVPCHKKEKKISIKNYRAIILLPIFNKVFERTFNYLYNYVTRNKPFIDYQSGFIQGYLRVLLLLSITHKSYKSFDYNLPVDVRGTFLDT